MSQKVPSLHEEFPQFKNSLNKISINEDDINQFGLSSTDMKNRNRRTTSPRPKKRLTDIVDQLKNPLKVGTIVKLEPQPLPVVFKCIQKGFPECQTIFTSASEFELHQRLWHSNYIPYECKYCCKRFLQQNDCNVHSLGPKNIIFLNQFAYRRVNKKINGNRLFTTKLCEEKCTFVPEVSILRRADLRFWSS